MKSQSFQTISLILIFILIIALVMFFWFYYNQSSEPVAVPSYTVNTPIIKTNPEDTTSIVSSNINESSDKTNVDVGVTEVIRNDNAEIETQETHEVQETQVIISSEANTSNKEKQEILNEIDNVLDELLTIVDKVQTVDETRLGIDEGEVQP